MKSTKEIQTLKLLDNGKLKKNELNKINIQSFFTVQAIIKPNAIAIEHVNERLSYKELESLSNQFAQYLIDLGLSKESVIGICLERQPNMIAMIIGILKAGLAYVPLDPSYPAERVNYMLKDSNANFVICNFSTQKVIQHSQTKVLLIEDIQRKIANLNQMTVHKFLDTYIKDNMINQLAYIIYTSGSTGKPKGVMIEHASVIALLNWSRSFFSEKECKKVLCSTSVCFDLFIFEVWATLSIGGCILLVDNALDLLQNKSLKPTLINTVPSVAKTLIEQGYQFEGVSTMNLAGEPLKKTLVNDLLSLSSVKSVNNLYGPSEDTTYSTYAHFSQLLNTEPTIGIPIEGTVYEILDQNSNRVALGEVGELCLGGSGLSRGYYNQPEMTSEKFINNPFDSYNNRILYKTGDLVKLLPNGKLDYQGRTDHQVKIRGFRIELLEIESALLNLKKIIDVVVVAAETESIGDNDKFLAAYIVVAPELIPQPQLSTDEAAVAYKRVLASLNKQIIEDCKRALSAFLPNYMVPSSFTILDKLPLTLNGKIDRKLLPKPTINRLKSEHEESMSDDEKRLSQLWKQVLPSVRFNRSDSFFDLGGHSLNAAKLLSLIKNEFGLTAKVSDLFRYPSIESFSESIINQQDNIKPTNLMIFHEVNDSVPLFMVPGAGGRASYLYDMANQFRGKRSIYAFQAKGIDDDAEPHTSIEEMACFYVELLTQAYPVGPVFLMGHSFGAPVAYEMCRQLEKVGREVPLLTVLDGGDLTGDPVSNQTAFRHVARILAYFKGKTCELTDQDILGSGWQEQLEMTYQLIEEKQWSPDGLNLKTLESMVNTYQTHFSIGFNCEGQYASQVALFYTQEFETYRQQMNLKQFSDTWKTCSMKPVYLEKLTCGHLAMMQAPNVAFIASKIECRLNEALLMQQAVA